MGMYLHKARLAYKYYRNLVQKRPISVNLEVTKRCNARCDFCDYWKLKKEDALTDYGPVIKQIDPMVVSLTGGEPLLRPDIIQVVQSIRRAVPNCYLAMVTNGSLLTVEKAKDLRLAGIDQLSISLDFLDERHDLSRHIPGLWNRISQLVPKLTELDFDAININWIVMEENFDQTTAVAHWAYERGACVSYTSYCDAKGQNDGHYLSEENLNKFPSVIDELKKFKRKNRTIRSSDYYLDHMAPYYRHEPILGCRAGLRWIQITPEGYFKACSELPNACSWKDYDRKKTFSPQSCTMCWYCCRGEAQTPIDIHRIKEFIWP